MTTITFRGYMFDCRHRLLWQALFDIYRQHSGDLSNMDNLLIDLENCNCVVHDVMELGKPRRFVWGMDVGGYQTAWIDEADFHNGDTLLTAQACARDLTVIATVSKHEASLAIATLYHRPASQDS